MSRAGLRRVMRRDLLTPGHPLRSGLPRRPGARVGPTDRRFTEDDRSLLDGPGTGTYDASTTRAEQATWADVRGEGAGLDLVSLSLAQVEQPSIVEVVDVVRPRSPGSHRRRAGSGQRTSPVERPEVTPRNRSVSRWTE